MSELERVIEGLVKQQVALQLRAIVREFLESAPLNVAGVSGAAAQTSVDVYANGAPVAAASGALREISAAEAHATSCAVGATIAALAHGMAGDGVSAERVVPKKASAPSARAAHKLSTPRPDAVEQKLRIAWYNHNYMRGKKGEPKITFEEYRKNRLSE